MKKGASYRYLTYKGETKTLAEWSRATGIERKTLSDRIDASGWTIEEAIETRPLRTKGVTHRYDKEYTIWRHMRERCYSPKDRYYGRYGGRGITVYGPWRQSYKRFLADIGKAPSPRHTFDRIDNNGNYEPGNVRWATQKEQANNRSGPTLRKITYNGETRNLSEWAEHLGINFATLCSRINRYGWPIEKALATPTLQNWSTKKGFKNV